MVISATEKDNSQPIVIVGRDELHGADVNDVDVTGKKRLLVQNFHYRGSATNIETVSSNYVIDKNFVQQVVVSGTTGYTLYTYTGSGILLGFHIDSDTDKLQVKLVIDSNDIFNGFIEVKSLKELKFDAGTGRVSFQSRSLIATDRDDFDFDPQYPIAFNSSMSIIIKRSDGNNTKVKKYFVEIVKE